jgi:hypothetical protein
VRGGKKTRCVVLGSEVVIDLIWHHILSEIQTDVILSKSTAKRYEPRFSLDLNSS